MGGTYRLIRAGAVFAALLALAPGRLPAQPFGGFRPSAPPPLARPLPPDVPLAPLTAPALRPPEGPPVPVVAVSVRVPAEAAPGEELVYRISVVNTSQAAAHHVVLRNPLPANVRFLRANPEPTGKPESKAGTPVFSWALGTLAAGARREVELVVVPTGTGDIQNCARVQFEHGQCVRTRISRPGLRLRKKGPAEGARADIISYHLEVTNTGRAPARKVKLTDVLPEPMRFMNSNPSTGGETNKLTWDLGDLPPGVTRRVEYSVLLEKAGTFTNKAVAEAEGGLRDEAGATIRVGESALALSLTGPKLRRRGRPALFRITVRNPGTRPTGNVQVVDELPADIVFLRASDGGQLVGKEVRWSLARVGPGERRTLTLEVQARRAGRFKNVVTATDDRGPKGQAQAETRFEEGAGLGVEMETSDERPAVGADTIVTLRVVNPGKAEEKGLGLTLTVPAGLRVTGFRGPTGSRLEGEKLIFDPLPSLPPAAEATWSARLRAERAGPARLEAEVRAGAGAAARAEETITVAAPP